MKETEDTTQAIEPLRILRTQAGEKTPLTQAEIATVTDIALDTVRAIENHRRLLTAALLRKIKHAIGAVWDERRRVWHLTDSPETLYSPEIYLKFRTRWWDEFFQLDLETHILCRRLVELMQRVDAKQSNTLFYRIFDFLDQTREELRINSGTDSVFEKTQFKLEVVHRDKSQEREIIEIIARQFKQIDDDILAKDSKKGALLLDLSPWALSRTSRAHQLMDKQKAAKGRRYA